MRGAPARLALALLICAAALLLPRPGPVLAGAAKDSGNETRGEAARAANPDEAAAPEHHGPEDQFLDMKCAPSDKRPRLVRKSIAIRGGHFGEGYLSLYDGALVMSLHGNDWERGYQHGAMLRDLVRERIGRAKLSRDPKRPFPQEAREALAHARSSWPEWAIEELEGMAEGSGVPMRELAWLNLLAPLAERPRGPGGLAPGARDQPPPDMRDPALDLPGWAVFFAHDEKGRVTVYLASPGSLGAALGMQPGSCCLAAAIRSSELGELDAGEASLVASGLALRRWLGEESCGRRAEDIRHWCGLALREEGGPLTAVVDSERGLVCVSRDDGESWSAIDAATETWRPDCGLCGD